MSVNIITPGVWKVQLPVVGKGNILIYNESMKFIHEIDMDSAPVLVDYVRQDREFNGLKTYVWGFIEDGLLVVERRVPNPGW